MPEHGIGGRCWSVVRPVRSAWPELRIVDDADYKEALRRTAMMNPLREPRLLARSVANLSRQMTDWFQVGVGLACANGPKVEIKLAIGGGAVMDVEGEKQTAFFVRTNAETPRFCVVTNRHAAAYERVENDPPMPAIGDVEGMRQAIADGRLRNYKGPTVGKKRSHVEPETIAGVIALAYKYASAAALDLLLRRADVDPNGASVAPLSIEAKSGGAVVKWLVAAGGRAFFALSNPNGSMLFRAEDTAHLASVRRDEAAQHAARAEAGAIKT